MRKVLAIAAVLALVALAAAGGYFLRPLPEAPPTYDDAYAAVHSTPRDPDAWIALGDAQSQLDELAAAEHAYRTALRLDRERADTYARLGFLLFGQGRDAEAKPLLAEARRRGATAPMLDTALAQLEGAAVENPGDLADARRAGDGAERPRGDDGTGAAERGRSTSESASDDRSRSGASDARRGATDDHSSANARNSGATDAVDDRPGGAMGDPTAPHAIDDPEHDAFDPRAIADRGLLDAGTYAAPPPLEPPPPRDDAPLAEASDPEPPAEPLGPCDYPLVRLTHSRALGIDVTFGGVDARLVFDTGATMTVVTTELADLMRLPRDPDRRIVARTANGRVVMESGVVDAVQLAGRVVSGTRVAVCGDCTQGVADGLFGLDLVAAFGLTVDPTRGVATFDDCR